MDGIKKLQQIAAKGLGGKPEDYVVANERVARKGGGAGMTLAKAAQRAIELGGRCEGARTPLLCREVSATSLTRREREVVLLAANHPSRQIAERLGLSVNTVNNYLARAYAKLGVAGRGELRTLVGPP